MGAVWTLKGLVCELVRHVGACSFGSLGSSLGLNPFSSMNSVKFLNLLSPHPSDVPQ